MKLLLFISNFYNLLFVFRYVYLYNIINVHTFSLIIICINVLIYDKFNFIAILLFFRCLKRYLTPVCIEKPNVMEMCGRICSILTLFIPTSNYNFENLLTSLNLIYDRVNINLGKFYILSNLPYLLTS